MYNILINDLPTTVKVGSREKEIFTDFREFVELAILFEVGNNEEISAFIFDLFKDDCEYTESEIKAVSDFMSCYEMADGYALEKTGKANADPVFSFDDDMPYIVSGFRQYYGIDLVHVNYLHWFEFNVYLKGLPEDSEFKKRVYYRTINTGKIKDKEERKRIRKIQSQIAIKNKRRKYLSDTEIGNAF